MVLAGLAGRMLSTEGMRNLLIVILFSTTLGTILAGPSMTGLASWYGEEHRGKLMADGHLFDPDKLTAASWLYRLGTRIRVTTPGSTNSVEVTITDRGPARGLAQQGRIIDLSRAAFERLANRNLGVINVTVSD